MTFTQLVDRVLEHMTQKALAQRLGVTQQTVSRWASGAVVPTTGSAALTLLELLQELERTESEEPEKAAS